MLIWTALKKRCSVWEPDQVCCTSAHRAPMRDTSQPHTETLLCTTPRSLAQSQDSSTRTCYQPINPSKRVQWSGLKLFAASSC